MNSGIDLEMDCRVIIGVGGCTEFCSDRMCLELCFGNILEMVSKDCVPLQMQYDAIGTTYSNRMSINRLDYDNRR